MAILTNTYTQYTAIGDREDLQDMIFDITPTDTPFISGMGRGKAVAVIHEWQTDSLAAAVTSNQQFEGDDVQVTTDSRGVSTRVGNVCEIARKLITISGTLEAIDKAGRKSEMAYQLAKAGKEIKRDLESALLDSHAAVSGAGAGTGTARVAAPLMNWIQTNSSRGTDGVDSTSTSGGVPTYACVDATTTYRRALTEALAKTVIQSLWTNGGEADVLMAGAFNRQAISSSFAGIATRNFDLSKATPTAAIASVDVYVSDFGTFKVIPNRFQRARDLWLLDFNYLALAFLRPMQTIKLAKTGDAERRMLLSECTLVVKNEAAHGVVADLTEA
jgi:hypothetical protein